MRPAVPHRAERRLLGLGLAAALLAVLAVVHAVAIHAGEVRQAVAEGDTSGLHVAGLFLLVLSVLAVVSATRVAGSLARSVAAQRGTRARLAGAPVSRIAGHVVHVLEDRRPYAFCTGLLRPRIAVSRGALDGLPGPALAAIVAHEAEHARRHDGLRRVLTGALRDGAIGARTVERLVAAAAAEAELAADRRAVADVGRAELAQAMVAVADDRIATERVDQLLGRAVAPSPRIPLLVAAALVAGLAGASLGLHAPDDGAVMTATTVLLAPAALTLALRLRPSGWPPRADVYDLP
jgi:Zn-dependent protease with chaperone function